MNRDVASGQDIGKGGALRVGRKVGDNMWEWAVGRIVCVCVFYVSVFVLCLVYSMLSVHSVTRSFN